MSANESGRETEELVYRVGLEGSVVINKWKKKTVV